MSNYGSRPFGANDNNTNAHAPNPAFNNDPEWLWPDDLVSYTEDEPPQLPHIETHFHRQLPPLHQTSPSASLNAALREGTTLPSIRTISHMGTSASTLARTPHPPHNQPIRQGFTYVPHSSPSTPATDENHTDEQTHPIFPARSVYFNPPIREEPPMPRQRPTIPTTTTVDLTSGSNNMPATQTNPPQPRKRWREILGSPDPEPGAKRRRGSAKDEPEHIDLEDDEDAAAEKARLEKEKADQIQRQKEESAKQVKLSDRTCMICMESYTNMSATHCGHIFCHECLHQALVASERGSETGVGVCPACRKPIKRGRNAKHHIIPLALLKGKKKEQSQEGTGSKKSEQAQEV